MLHAEEKHLKNLCSTTFSTNPSSDSEGEDDIEITKVSTGSVDNFGPLAELGNSDYDVTGDIRAPDTASKFLTLPRAEHCKPSINGALA